MYSIRPYQAYSFRCGFSNNSILPFVVSMLPQDLVSRRSFHSIIFSVPEALWCWSSQPIISFVKDHVFFHDCPFNRSVVPSFQVLSPYQVLIQFLSFNRSAARSCSSSFLFSNGVFSTSFIFVVFFLSICSTSQGSLVSFVCQRSNLVLPLLFLFLFPPVPS